LLQEALLIADSLVVFVRSYDSLGNLAWSNTSSLGSLNAIKYDSNTNSLFLAGQTNGNTPDFLLERWDTNGNLIWSRTFDRNGGADILNGIGISNGAYIAVGATTGLTAVVKTASSSNSIHSQAT